MNLNNIKPKEILPGFYGKIIHGEKNELDSLGY